MGIRQRLSLGLRRVNAKGKGVFSRGRCCVVPQTQVDEEVYVQVSGPGASQLAYDRTQAHDFIATKSESAVSKSKEALSVTVDCTQQEAIQQVPDSLGRAHVGFGFTSQDTMFEQRAQPMASVTGADGATGLASQSSLQQVARDVYLRDTYQKTTSNTCEATDTDTSLGSSGWIPLLMFIIMSFLAPFANVLCLVAAVVIYLCTGGDTKPFCILPIVQDPTWQLGVRLQRAASTAVPNLFRQLRNSKAFVVLIALSQKLSNAAAAVSKLCLASLSRLFQQQHSPQTLSLKVQSAVKSIAAGFRNILQQISLFFQETSESAKDVCSSFKHRSRMFFSSMKLTAVRSFTTMPQSIEGLLCHGDLVTLCMTFAITILLSVLETQPAQTLQAAASACVVVLVTAALCELSGASDAVAAVWKQLTSHSSSAAEVAFNLHDIVIGCTQALQAALCQLANPQSVTAAFGKAQARAHDSVRRLGLCARGAAVICYQAWATAWSIVSGTQKFCGSDIGCDALLAGSNLASSLLRSPFTGTAHIVAGQSKTPVLSAAGRATPPPSPGRVTKAAAPVTTQVTAASGVEKAIVSSLSTHPGDPSLPDPPAPPSQPDPPTPSDDLNVPVSPAPSGPLTHPEAPPHPEHSTHADPPTPAGTPSHPEPPSHLGASATHHLVVTATPVHSDPPVHPGAPTHSPHPTASDARAHREHPALPEAPHHPPHTELPTHPELPATEPSPIPAANIEGPTTSSASPTRPASVDGKLCSTTTPGTSKGAAKGVTSPSSVLPLEGPTPADQGGASPTVLPKEGPTPADEGGPSPTVLPKEGAILAVEGGASPTVLHKEGPTPVVEKAASPSSVLPAPEPAPVVDTSTALAVEVSVKSAALEQVFVDQLASVAFEIRCRSQVGGSQDAWSLVPCHWNPTYMELHPRYGDMGLVGRGSQGYITYAQYQNKEGSWVPVAVKWIVCDSDELVAQARRELAAMRAVRGAEHTVQLLHVHESDVYIGNSTYLVVVMGFINSVNLEGGLAQQRSVAWESQEGLARFLDSVITVFKGVVKGVCNTHAAGWAHLDLKPANFCVDQRDGVLHPFLVDYGSAYRLEASFVSNVQSSWPYAAPEVLRTYEDPDRPELKDKVNKAAQDLYSLGCVLLWLLTGQDIFAVTAEKRQRAGLVEDRHFLKACRSKRNAVAIGLAGGSSGKTLPEGVALLLSKTEQMQDPTLSALKQLAATLLSVKAAHRGSPTTLLAELNTIASKERPYPGCVL